MPLKLLVFHVKQSPYTFISLDVSLLFCWLYLFSCLCVCVCALAKPVITRDNCKQERIRSGKKAHCLGSVRDLIAIVDRKRYSFSTACAREENPIKRWQNIYTRTKTPRNQKKTNEASTWIWWNTWTSGDVRTSKNLKWPHLTTIDREKRVISWFPGTWTEYSMTITVSNGGNYEALWVEALMFSSYIL